MAGNNTFTIPGSITATGRIVTSKWASLSDKIIFEANQSAVEMMMKPNVANFVEQDLLVGKPRLQKIGLRLQEIKVTLKFHFSIRPFRQIKADLAEAAINGTVLQWIWGTGEAVGDFVIVDWSEKPKKTDEEGAIYCTEIDITLKEYAGPGVSEQTQIDAKKAAFANKKPNSTAPALQNKPTTPAEDLSQGIQDIAVGDRLQQQALDKFKKDQISMQNYKRSIVAICGDMKKAVNRIQTAVTILKNVKNANGISAKAALVATATDSLQLAAGVPTTMVQFSSLANDVSLTAGSLNQAAQGAQVVKSWFAPLVE